MQKIAREKAVHVEFGGDMPPELRVKLGETFIIETNDNWWNLLGKEGAVPSVTEPPTGARQYVRGNPVGGPVYVEGVEPGDTLVINLEDIAVRDWGWTGTIPGFGPLAGLAEWKDIDEPFSDGYPSCSRTVGHPPRRRGSDECWPGSPLAARPVPGRNRNGRPSVGSKITLVSHGPWGGNLDVRDICAGHKIHMNATHAGGMLFLGDVHASQGDSELTGIADETAADVTLSWRCDQKSYNAWRTADREAELHHSGRQRAQQRQHGAGAKQLLP